ncbi:hypothetical protein K402DRAFT_329847 [Aulographum hederae CBS 113979]|uniref:Large ribosomal subunit protein mL59 domain-containing protein n=1 Tax=Aulographum hederae CBS 113979 TaxID=1176131 RepID=A0A6G1H3T6_9PEZI|nr:hypothetical protein K402DRAFT_329847 [Aulographum hederae CBS 113979]
MSSINWRNVNAAKKLPDRLLNFFAKYPPPPAIFERKTTFKSLQLPKTTSEPVEIPSTTSSTDPNASSVETVADTLPPGSEWTFNPFAPQKNFTTGRWRGPIYGLRQQADLCKLAQKCGALDLMPPSIKNPETRAKRREELGLRVKGTGVGQKVKGHIWERKIKGKLEKRRVAMEGMPEMIRLWKQRGHGRGWKKFPK